MRQERDIKRAHDDYVGVLAELILQSPLNSDEWNYTKGYVKALEYCLEDSFTSADPEMNSGDDICFCHGYGGFERGGHYHRFIVYKDKTEWHLDGPKGVENGNKS